MKIFRTAFVIPAVIIVVLVWVFFAFYFDFYLKKGIIAGGEAAFGAKVEIGSLNTTFTKLSININAMKIGDKDDEFKNLADIDNINFKVRFIPLLSKKVIIDNMSVSGFKWSTARKTSCKLPEKKKKKKSDENSLLAKTMKQIKDKSEAEYNALPSVQKFGEIQEQIKDFSPEGAIDMAGIKSVGKLKDSYVGLMGKYDSYSKTVNGLDTQKQIDSVKESIDKLSKISVKTPADIAVLRENITLLNEQRKSLETTYNDLKNVQAGLSKDIADQQKALKDVNALINQDVDNIASKLSIPSLDFKNVSRTLFGDVWVNKVDSVLYYMSIARKYMPQKSEEDKKKAQAQERLKGREITYPLKGTLPSFWIANISMSGTSGGEGKDIPNPVSFRGVVQNITSDQKLIGKAMTFELYGDNTNQTFKINGKFDRLGNVAQDVITVVMDGVDAAALGVADTDYTPSFAKAKAKINAEFALKGNDYTTKAGVVVTGLTYDAASKNFSGANAATVKYVNALWNGIDSVSVQAKTEIIENKGFNMSFTSNIDSLLGSRFSNIINSAAGDVKDKIRQEVTSYVNDQKKVLQSDADKYKSGLQSELEPKLRDVQKQIDDAKSLIAQKENEIKKQAVSSSGLGSLFSK
ncbi:TIGR03545 family protein [Endomicrobium proavitum]|uniref:TIGR03545 family protein n=1 Tax=Endomicrobium proavitum TaxID=1408281 RepID=A0A0G3WI13_9BACT|nr:TIGR03545 family protein [Endomicrobium proavitum]AKL97520.1 hypothetical protein Epro_0141 [Endomicrobium proavitum]